MNLFSNQMGDHLKTTSTVNNMRTVSQTRQNLVNNNKMKDNILFPEGSSYGLT